MGTILPGSLRYPMRRWRHRPALAATAVLVLALGIGATTAMFSIVDIVLLRDDPWPDADRLVAIHAVLPEQRANPAYHTRWNRMPISWQSWRDLQQSPAFADVGAWVPAQQIVGDDRPELVRAFYASSTLLSMLGVRPVTGRFIDADEEAADSGVVVISHRLWQRLFGGQPDVLGKTLTVTGPDQSAALKTARRVVVGVIPEHFTFPGDTPDILLPIGIQAYNGSFGNAFLRAIGRLAPGVSVDMATTSAEPLVRRDEPAARRAARIVTLKMDRIGIGDRPLWLMLAGAALLLVVACSNVAGLLLSDARSRHRETAVRLALGGTRIAILRQRTAEHAVLAVAAGAAGVTLAWWLVPALVALAPPGLIGNQTASLNQRIAAWSLALGVVTTLLAGLLPAAATASASPGDALKRGTRDTAGSGRWRHRLVVAAQFSLALVLLVGAGLFSETLLRLGRQPLGFSPDGVAVVSVAKARATAAARLTPEEAAIFADLRRNNTTALGLWIRQREWVRTQSLIDRVDALPGVMAVATTMTAPFTAGPAMSANVRAEHQPQDAAHTVSSYRVSEQYFEALGTSILRGRSFNASDRLAARAVIVSAELERRVFGAEAIGRRLMVGKTALEVVGVAADVRTSSRPGEDLAAVYMIASRDAVNHLVIRTAGDVRGLLPDLRQAIESHSDPMFVTATAALSDLVDGAIVLERARAILSGTYGLAALLLATIGLYGLAARLVADRRREIGIRIALGAAPRNIRRLVMADASTILVIGLLVGLPTALIASRFAEGLLYGVTPAAPHVLIVAAAALGSAAVIATVIPSWRASRIDPALTLREE